MVFVIIFVFFILITPEPVFAYIGPGAGFVFVSSFLIIFISIFLSLMSLLLFPFRVLKNKIKRKKKGISKTNTKRVIIAGFDGMDPELTEKLMNEGKLPNFRRLKEIGTFSELQTTYPPISPVAWSSFSTGTNPAKHNIFDFLAPDRNTYMSTLSSVNITKSSKNISLGKYKIPLKKPKISLLRKSKAFWKILGEHGIYSIILRVPLTYPPEKFFGAMLSGMCVPDILGTQGTFTYFSTNSKKEHTGGQQIEVKPDNGKIETYIPGPSHPFLKEEKQLKSKLEIFIENDEKIKLNIGKKKYELNLNKYSDWIEIPFKVLPGIKITGIAQFLLTSVSPDFKLYVTPININPEKPSLPIGTPKIFPVYLSKLIGKYSTLGLAEDTWALDEGIIDEKTFWEQSVAYFREREKMFFHSLNKIKNGTVACVFDLTDRIQHMFMRYINPEHPDNEKKVDETFRNAIEDSYKLADEMIGKIIGKMNETDAVIVLSDHGFKKFDRGFNLNKWLYENGYLFLKDSKEESGEWFRSVDWNKTKAYGLGLTGLYINQKGREKKGIVGKGKEKDELMLELRKKLLEVKDNGKPMLREVYITDVIYNGPYKENAPDIILGFYTGYRTSWNSVIGKVTGEIIEDNTRKWSGDHCLDPREVPGILFSNRKITSNNPKIIDICPSILKLLGIKTPKYMDGQSIFEDVEIKD